MSCECGVPNCRGHEVGPDGKVHIYNHPRGKRLVMDLNAHEKGGTHGENHESWSSEAG